MEFHNRVTDLLGVEIPIVQAPMGWIARSQLASAVSNAGPQVPNYLMLSPKNTKNYLVLLLDQAILKLLIPEPSQVQIKVIS